MKFRFWFLIFILISSYVVLLLHLYKLQLTDNQYYVAKAESQFSSSDFILAKRGTIYFTDKNGNYLAAAVDQNFPLIYAVPSVITDWSGTLSRLSSILGKSIADLENLLSDKKAGYALLERKAGTDIVQEVDQANLEGIYANSVPERFYPLGTTAAQVLGFVGPNVQNNGESGKYGLEEYYNSALSGVSGSQKNNQIVSPKDGEDIFLTIDPNIQAEAEGILSNLLKTSQATGGSIIVEEPATGKILTMASSPTFDPNNYSQADLQDFSNPSIQGLYEVGSVIKVLTMAAGIDSGKLTPETTYFDTGSVIIDGKKIENYDLVTHGPYGRATMTNVIEHSINTGAVFAESKIGNTIFRNYLTRFGLNQPTGIDLPNEISGNLNQLFKPYVPQIEFATAAFGQGVAVTQLELINAVAAIANGGQLMRPYLNSALGPKVIRTVISSSTATQVTQMMVSAIDKAGVTTINGYSLAGKTGTGQVPNLKNGGYTKKVIDTYVGFGPASNPRFIALVKIDEPPGAPVAALTVVPAFRELAQFILNYYNISPDRL